MNMSDAQHDAVVGLALMMEEDLLKANEWTPRKALEAAVGVEGADRRYVDAGEDCILALKWWCYGEAKRKLEVE